MKHWNYRVVRKEGFLCIYSVYYDENGNIENFSLNPEPAIASEIDEVKTQLTLMLESTEKEILDFDDLSRITS